MIEIKITGNEKSAGVVIERICDVLNDTMENYNLESSVVINTKIKELEGTK